MLTATNRTVDNRPVKSPVPQGDSKLRPITPAEADVWAAALRNQSSSNFEFIHLDEPHDYPFKVCDSFFLLIQRFNLIILTRPAILFYYYYYFHPEGPRSCLGTHERR